MKTQLSSPKPKSIPLIEDILIPVIEVSDNKLSEENTKKSNKHIPIIKDVKIPTA